MNEKYFTVSQLDSVNL